MKNKMTTVTLGVAFIGLMATLMIFLPAIRFENTDAIYTGLEATFGVEIGSLGTFVSAFLAFNILGVLAFLLPLAGGLMILLFPKGALISMAIFVVSAVLLFTLPEYTDLSTTLFGSTTIHDIDWVIQPGLTVAGILSSIGAAACLFQVVDDFGPRKR